MTFLQPDEAIMESDDLKEQSAVFSVREIYDKYSPLLFSTIKRVIPDNTQAEETLVEVFIELHNNHQNLDLKQNALVRILINSARSKAIERLCRMQTTFNCSGAFKTFSNGEKTVFALFHFRKYSIEQIEKMFHLRQTIAEKLLQSAEFKIKG